MGEAAQQCDVLIIGAGPGGGSAGLHTSRAGLKTIIVEADPEVGTPVHCGECLSHIAVENLDLEIPDHVKALDVKGIRVIFPDGTEKLLTEKGYVLEKHLFERWPSCFQNHILVRSTPTILWNHSIWEHHL
mgnify:CR=1 FL=1